MQHPKLLDYKWVVWFSKISGISRVKVSVRVRF